MTLYLRGVQNLTYLSLIVFQNLIYHIEINKHYIYIIGCCKKESFGMTNRTFKNNINNI